MIPFRGLFRCETSHFFPFNQVAFLATLLFRHGSFRLPEEIGIPRSGPLRVPAQRSMLLTFDKTWTRRAQLQEIKCASQTQSDV